MRQITLFFAFFGLLASVCLAGGTGGPSPVWEGVVVHHTASPAWTTRADVDRWHRERGFDMIGYHFLILADGSITEGRPLSMVGAHALNPAPGRNRTHIGIALVGEDHFNVAQYHALRALLRSLEAEFGVLPIESHHEQCPGDGFAWGALTLAKENE